MKLTQMLEGVGRPIAYYPSLTKITGGVKETIFLCQLIYWRGKEADSEGWLYKTQEEWRQETGLSRREQEHARKVLKEKGFIEETRGGMPAQLQYRLKKEKINEAWSKEQSASSDEHVQTSMAQTAKQECTKPPNKNGEKRQTDARTHNAHARSCTETTSETTTESTETPKAKVPFAEIKQSWNLFAEQHGLSTIRKLTSKRKRKVRARWREWAKDNDEGDPWQTFRAVCSQILQSGHLMGDNDRGWQVSFDFVIKNDTKWVKILEGDYQDTRSPQQKQHSTGGRPEKGPDGLTPEGRKYREQINMEW